MVEVHRSDFSDQPHSCLILGVRRSDDVARPGNQAQIRNRGLDGQFLKPVRLPRHEIVQRRHGPGDAETAVQIGSTEVGVDDAHAVYHLSEGDTDIRREQLLPTPPLPPPMAHTRPPVRARTLGAGRG